MRLSRIAANAADRAAELSIDDILRILENPTRRKILERLVKESHYPLQLSRELRVSQQAVVKHLRVLEEGRLVESHEEPSDVGGPRRRAYSAKRALSVTIDVGPNLFHTDVRSLESAPTGKRENAPYAEALGRISEASDVRRQVRQAADLIERVSREIDELDRKRASLVAVKDRALRIAHQSAERLFSDYEQRSVLYALLEEGFREVSDLAVRLDLREAVVTDVLRKLTSERILL